MEQAGQRVLHGDSHVADDPLAAEDVVAHRRAHTDRDAVDGGADRGLEVFDYPVGSTSTATGRTPRRPGSLGEMVGITLAQMHRRGIWRAR